jgi:hypothetical protein
VSGLANVNGPAEFLPSAPVLAPSLLADTIEGTSGACDVPVVQATSLTAAQLERPVGAPRPQCYGASYGRGMTTWWPGLSGDHGWIPDPVSAAQGQQEPWRSWNPRTLRHEPTTPWDDGVVVGAGNG